MITGFNTNVRYQGRVFHVQTEDSGRNHPHVISHIYYEGSILGSQKSDYAARVGSEDLDIQVRALMERQHKKMLKRLESGEFDAVIAERLGVPAPAQPAAEPESEPAPAAVKADPVAAPLDADASKPLDEAILDYLVQKQRTRPTSSGRRSKE